MTQNSEEGTRSRHGVDKPRGTSRTYLLSAALGVSVGLNAFLGLKAYKPKLWHQIELAMIRPPVLRADDHVRGPSKASVTVIEYSDFQCPFSAQVHSSLKRLAAEGRIKWVYRSFPLSSIHPRAIQAAEAAECAAEQGKFWEYADVLFDNQRELQAEASPDAFSLLLRDLVGVNHDRFRNCLSAHQFQGRVLSQLAEGNSKHVDATPTLFVNGKRQVGLLPYERLEELVQSQPR